MQDPTPGCLPRHTWALPGPGAAPGNLQGQTVPGGSPKGPSTSLEKTSLPGLLSSRSCRLEKNPAQEAGHGKASFRKTAFPQNPFSGATEPPPRQRGQGLPQGQGQALRAEALGGSGRWGAGGAGRDVGTLSCQLPTPFGDTAPGPGWGSQHRPVSFLNVPKTTSNQLAREKSHPMAFLLLRPGPWRRA